MGEFYVNELPDKLEETVSQWKLDSLTKDYDESRKKPTNLCILPELD